MRRFVRFSLFAVLAVFATSDLSTANAAPAAFTLVNPIAGAETGATTITFRWSTSTDTATVTYRLIVDTDLAGSFVLDTSIAETSTTYTFSKADTYMWRVIASDTPGDSRTVGDSTFLIDTTLPVAAVQLTLADGAETKGVSITLTWTAAYDTHSGLQKHQVQIDTAGTFSLKAVDSSAGLQSSTTVVLAPNETYFWRIIAFDDAGNTSATTADSFIVDTRLPAVATLRNPADFAETREVSITFYWDSAADTGSGLQKHQFQIDTSGNFTTKIVDSSAGLQSSTTIVLRANDTYYWRVVAFDDAGNTSAASADSFKIDTQLPIAASLLLPASGIETNVSSLRFTWVSAYDTISGLNRHSIQTGTSTAFSPLLIDSSTSTNTSATLSLAGTETYYWRILAVDDAGNTSVSDSARFTIDTSAPSAVTLGAPQNISETNSIPVLFTWSAATDTTSTIRYRLQLANDTGFDTIVIDSTGISGTSALVSVKGDSWYAWRVAAYDSVGNAGTSSFLIVGVDTHRPNAPALVSPIGGATQTSGNILLKWGAAADTVLGNSKLVSDTGDIRYFFQVSADSSFTTVTKSETTADTFNYLLLTVKDSGTFYWRVAGVDSAGNYSAYDTSGTFVRAVVTDTNPPLPPFDFTGVALETGAAKLTWGPSASSDMTGGGYRLYWDAAAGTYPTQFLAFESHTTAASYSLVKGALTKDSTYRFRLQSMDASGNEDAGNNIVQVTAIDTKPGYVRTLLTEPFLGAKVLRGNAIPVFAEISGDSKQKSAVGSLRFQYRSGSSWSDMAVVSGQTNPALYAGAATAQRTWNASAVALGSVDLRVIPVITGGFEPDTLATIVSIELVDSATFATYVTTASTTNDTVFVSRAVNRNQSDTVLVVTPSGAEYAVFVDTGAAPSALDTGQVKLNVTVRPTSLPPVDTSTIPAIRTVASSFVELAFSDSSQPGKAVYLEMPLPTLSADSNYTIGTKSFHASSLEAWGYSAETGSWQQLPTPSIDLADKVARIQVDHFSFFTLAAPVGATSNLASFVVYPVPFKPNDGDATTGVEFQAGVANTGITFENLPQFARIQIYTTLGEYVDEGTTDATGGLQWDVRNTRGEQVASGVYIYMITTLSGERAMGKLMVIR